jgi:long-chain acyl-CoA synthetase
MTTCTGRRWTKLCRQGLPTDTTPGYPAYRDWTGFTAEGSVLVDRKRDMISAAGYTVWPREAEGVLYGPPAVREAAVIGVPDDDRGETVEGYVSLKPGATVTGEELIKFCGQQMAAYQYPRSVQFVDDPPKTTTGKTLRRDSRDWNS